MADFFLDEVTSLHIPEANAVTIGNIPVEVENPLTNQVLAFENNKWVNMSGGGGSDASSILNVPVTFTSPADGDVIAFNGSASLKNKTLFPLTNSNLSSMSAGTWKGNPTGSSHIPYDVAVGNLSESTSNVLTITGGTGALLNNATIQVQQASSTLPGYVSAADYVRFGTASGGITALTGDVAATGPGSAAAVISNATVTGKVLTGYTPSTGSIAATDSILGAIQKTGGSLGTSAGQVVLGNASGVATPTTITGDVSLSNTGVATVNATGKTLTGYVASPGTLTSSDTILTGFGKVGASLAASSGQVILGNSSNVATPTTVSGDVSISNTGVTTVNVTGKTLTGYVASSGSLAATDTVLTGFQKVGGSLATSPAQIVMGSNLGIATPTAVSGDVTLSNSGLVTLKDVSVTGKSLTGFSSSSGTVSASDTLLTGLGKLAGSLNASPSQIILGNASGVATPTTLSGDVTVNNTGVTTLSNASATGKLLTGYTPTAGQVSSSDSLLQGFNKVGSSLNTSSGQIVVGNSSGVASPVTMSGAVTIDNAGVTSLSPTGITSTLLTGYTPTAGKVSATDTILQGLNKVGNSLNVSSAQIIVGNSSGVAIPVNMSGAVTINNTGATSLSTPVTSTLLTGYTPTAGNVTATDSILSSFNKMGNSLNTTSGQIVVGNASGVASPVTMSGAVTIDNTGVTSLTPTGITSTLLTGYTPTVGNVTATDSLLQGFGKVGNSINTSAGQIIVGNASGIASPVTMSGAVTISNAGVTSLVTPVTSTLLTGYIPTSGKIAATDSILSSANKVGNSLNTTSGQIIVGNTSGVATPVTMSGAITIDNNGTTSLSTPVTSTLLTGYTPTVGNVTATDSILQGMNKVGNSLNASSGQIIAGNASGVATPVTMSGAVTINNTGVTSLTPTSVTSTLLTGYTPTAGNVTATDSILQGMNKVGNSLNASSGQIIVGNATGVATPVTMSGDVNISNSGSTTVSNNAVTGKVLTGYTGTAGTISATDSILQAVQKAGASLNTTSAQVILGNASNVATPTTISGDVTLSNTGSATIGANVVTNAKSAQMATNTLKGNNTGSTANASDLTVAQVTSLISSTTPAASTIPQADANKNLTVNNLIIGATSTATAAGTTTLAVGSTGTQVFTGTTTQIVQLPAANTLTSGTSFTIINNSTGVLTLNNSTGTYACTVNSNSFLRITVVSTATAAGVWTWEAAFPVTVNAYLPITATFSPSLQLGNLLVRLNTSNGFQVAGVTAFTADVTGSGNYNATPFSYYGSGVYSASITTTFTNVLNWTSSGNAGNISKIFIRDITNGNKIYEINMVFFGPAGSSPASGFLSITEWV